MRPVELDIISGKLTLRIKGRINRTSAINISSCLEEAANIGTAHLNLDFGKVEHFDHAGIVLLAAVLRFYANDFKEITCCGLHQTVANLFRKFGLEKTDGLRICQRQ